MTIKEKVIYSMGYSKGYMKGVDFAIKHSPKYKRNEENENSVLGCLKEGAAYILEKAVEATTKLTDYVKTNFKKEDSKKSRSVKWIDAD